jgi:hypothetical protein
MIMPIVWGPFEKFIGSPYCSELELRGGAVAVSFSKYLLQRSTHFSKTCCRPFDASFRRIVEQAVLTSWSLRNLLPPLSWLEKPRNRMGARSELNSVVGLEKVDHWNPIRTSAIYSRYRPMQCLGFSARNFEVINGLKHVFEKWVERCKKWIACQGRYFEKETVTAPPQSSDSG